MHGRLATALYALMVALAACGPVATHARTAPESGVLDIHADMDSSGQPYGSIPGAGDGFEGELEFQRGRALLGPRMRPYVSLDRLRLWPSHMHAHE